VCAVFQSLLQQRNGVRDQQVAALLHQLFEWLLTVASTLTRSENDDVELIGTGGGVSVEQHCARPRDETIAEKRVTNQGTP
jgi:hypothetical protein